MGLAPNLKTYRHLEPCLKPSFCCSAGPAYDNFHHYMYILTCDNTGSMPTASAACDRGY
jgi:hypothetical protein